MGLHRVCGCGVLQAVGDEMHAAQPAATATAIAVHALFTLFSS